MPAHAFRRLDLDRVWAPFRAVAFELAAAVEARGLLFMATHGYRSLSEQAALHAAWKARKPGAGRAAPAGLSAHQYGLAFDFTHDASPKPGLQPQWADEAPYMVLGEEAERLGLSWGGRFHDGPHVQWPGYESASELAPLRGFLAGYGEVEGMRRVHELLTAEMETADWQRQHPALAATLRRLDFLPRLTASVA